jgi:hypothetical protein
MTSKADIQHEAVQRFEQCVLDLAAAVRNLQKRPKMKEYHRWRLQQDGDFHSPVTIETVIGDWSHALDLAEAEGVSREIVIAEVADLTERAGRVPEKDEWGQFGRFPKVGTICQLFRNWDEVATEAAERVDGVEWETVEESTRGEGGDDNRLTWADV